MEFDNLNSRPGNSWKLISGIMYAPDLFTIIGCLEFIRVKHVQLQCGVK